MSQCSNPIGVIDAGLGGFTVVKELQRLLPGEDIIFFGDGKNQPYGNRSQDEIIHLTKQCLTFLEKENVKLVAVACNTISTLIDYYKDDFPFKIFSIVEAACKDVADSQLNAVGLLATVFTVNSKCYDQLLKKFNPNIKIYAEGCPNLARLIEDGDFNIAAIKEELKKTLGKISAEAPFLETLILGCTHYPIISDLIKQEYPQFTTLINPAATQATQVKEYLTQNQLLNPQIHGSFKIYTTSDCGVYKNMAERLKLNTPSEIKLVSAPKLLYL